ncbi:MAG: hypothetical protein LBM78_01030, partial [Clostridiales bacterium]|nr:hypothetical protein [Clostridiales bacterium]
MKRLSVLIGLCAVLLFGGGAVVLPQPARAANAAVTWADVQLIYRREEYRGYDFACSLDLYVPPGNEYAFSPAAAEQALYGFYTAVAVRYFDVNGGAARRVSDDGYSDYFVWPSGMSAGYGTAAEEAGAVDQAFFVYYPSVEVYNAFWTDRTPGDPFGVAAQGALTSAGFVRSRTTEY